MSAVPTIILLAFVLFILSYECFEEFFLGKWADEVFVIMFWFWLY